MKRKKFSLILFLAAALVFGFSPGIRAGEGNASDYAIGVRNQLGRGFLNILSSPVDIPCTISDEMKGRENKFAGFFVGLGKGTVFMLRRILVGASEVGTFMLPTERTIPPVCQSF